MSHPSTAIAPQPLAEPRPQGSGLSLGTTSFLAQPYCYSTKMMALPTPDPRPSPPHALNLLRLLQLADSALPIGSLAHSFGLETLIADGHLSVAGLFEFLRVSLTENLLLDAVFCRSAHCRAHSRQSIEELNTRLSALRLARESREASLVLGKRFLSLVVSLEPELLCSPGNSHWVIAFGSTCGLLGFAADDTVSTFLHQSLVAAVSACQRLLRLGQTEASQIVWDLKPYILQATSQSATLSFHHVGSFAHLPELASTRHPLLSTRLFVS